MRPVELAGMRPLDRLHGALNCCCTATHKGELQWLRTGACCGAHAHQEPSGARRQAGARGCGRWGARMRVHTHLKGADERAHTSKERISVHTPQRSG